MRDAVEAWLVAAVADGVFPAAQAAVRAPGATCVVAVGRTATVGESAAVTTATRFDIASLTKALGTSLLLMQAVEEGALGLDDSVDRWLPGLPAAGEMSVRQVAMHRAGFAAHRPFYRVLWAEGVAPGAPARARVRALIESEPLEARPGATTCYSDLGYIVLGWIVEAALGGPLDALLAARVCAPLGLGLTSFGPVGPEEVAATEVVEGGQALRGVVHDENARALGGICGHAGMFSTATDVMTLVRHLDAVHRGESGGLARTDTVRAFWAPTGHRFTVGWDTPTEPSSSGRYTTRGAAVGHLGYTGCSVWHDLKRGVSIVLLSNRVHPTAQNKAIRAFRPLFHDAVNAFLAG